MGEVISFAEKIKSVQLAKGVSRSAGVKANDKNLALYRQARREGSQPRSSYAGEEAIRESDRLGKAFRADDLASTYGEPDFVKELKAGEGKSIIRPDEVKRAMEKVGMDPEAPIGT